MATSAEQATQLTQLFLQLGEAVDQFRNRNAANLSNDQIVNLVEVANQLTDTADGFNQQAVIATLQQVQGNVDALIAAAKDAQQAVKTINQVQNVFSIASAALGLGAAIASGNVATIASSSTTLVQAVSRDPGAGGGNNPSG